MKPLVALIISFVLCLLFFKITTKDFNFKFSARIAMSIMLIFTASGHFIFTNGMSMMIPKFIPFKSTFTYITGLIEIILAIGLLVPQLKIKFGCILIVFLVLMLPANVYAAVNRVNYQKGTLDGHGLTYLWFRIPLQVFFIIWVYISTIRK